MKRVLTVLVAIWLSVTVPVAFARKNADANSALRSQQNADTRAAGDASAASIWGTVLDAAGKPVDGAIVSIRAHDQTFTTSVFADESGAYVSPPLPSRRYRVWAQTTGFATARSEVLLGERPVSQSFTLQTLDDFSLQLTGSEWLDALPDTTVEDRRMKQIVRVTCSDCHSLAVVLQNRFDEQGWRILTRAMSEAAHNGWRGREEVKAQPDGVFTKIVRFHADEIATYLARVRGPGPSPVKFKPYPRPRGAAAQAVITEYDVPIGERPNELAWFDGSDWSKGSGVGMHGIVGLHDVMADPSGTVWIYESRTSFETHRTFTKLDPQTGKVTAYAVLRGNNVVHASQIEIDRSGNVWSQLPDGAMRWTPGTETMTVFPAPSGFPRFVNSIDSDSAGRVWYNAYYGAARLDPTTKRWQMFQQRTPFDGFSYGMAVDANDNAWWSAWNGDTVYKVDSKTGAVVEIPMRDPEYGARKALATPAHLDYYDSIGALSWGGNTTSHVPYANAPRRLSADKRSTSVWVPNWAGQNIAEIDIRTNKVTYHKLPITGHPYKTDVDAQRNVWATVPLADSLVKYDPTARKWTVYPFASHGCGPRHISVDRQRGEVWVPCDQSGKVARYQFRTAAQTQSQKAAAQAK